MIVQSSLLRGIPGIRHGFGSKSEPIPEILAPDWELKKPRWKQVHGAACCEVLAPGQDCGEVDALYSFFGAQPIAVVTADCVPILLARRDGAAVAAVHAGWKGTRAQITRALLTELRSRGESSSDWVAAIGPSIGPCCYEVSEELAADFAREFASVEGAVPSFRKLDLPQINRAELLEAGISAVDLIRACTRCSGGDSPLYHSYRREGGGTRQFSMIVRR